MKRILAALFFILQVNLSSANLIDQLKNSEEVNKFLKEKVFPTWGNEKIIDDKYGDTSGEFQKPYYKIDLNNDGRTDLLINAKYFLVVIDNGNEKYSAYFIGADPFESHTSQLVNIVKTAKPTLIVISTLKTKFDTITRHRRDYNFTIDTLVVKFLGLAEYNRQPENYEISQIKFSASGCYGTCPIFDMVFYVDRSARYNAIRFNDTTGNFSTSIDTASYNRLRNTINYIKVSMLDSAYSVPWTDDQTAITEITFKDGRVKNVFDYGMRGTYGLRNLYNQFFDLRASQHWK
jgi:hypothetical protein